MGGIKEIDMKGKMNTTRQGNIDTPMGTKPGKGVGVNKRDSAVATGTSNGGSTQHLRSGQVTRSKGSFAKYR